MWKFKWWKGKDKWLFLLTLGVILCILAFPADQTVKKMSSDREKAWGDSERENGGENQGGGQTVLPAAAGVSDSYEAELERRVRDILKKVGGVGQVDVMIVLKSSSEKVVQVDGSSSYSLTEEQDSSGGTRRTENQEQERSTVLMSEGGESSPLIAKELRPELSGIIISAEGGGNPTVKAEISAAMEALFGLPAHKIKVLKRVE